MDKNIVLSNDVKMPRLGLGVDTLHGDECINSVIWAIENGYRLIDTASCYYNEKEVGIAIKNCIDRGIVKREDLFITSKAPYHMPGIEDTINGYELSLKNLGLDYLDLYLIHSPYWNSFTWKEDIISTWKGMIKLYEEKKVRAIGVANFNSGLATDVMATSSLMLPHVNQFELHPQHQNKFAAAWCHKNNVQIEAWGTLNQGRLFDSKIMESLAKKYNKDIAQIAIRWTLQKGNCALVRSTKLERIKSNFDVWDFEISQEDMQIIENLDNGKWSHIHDEYENCPIAFLPQKYYWQKLENTKFKEQLEIKKFYLFGFIPFLIRKQFTCKTKWYLFGIPILKIKRKENK